MRMISCLKANMLSILIKAHAKFTSKWIYQSPQEGGPNLQQNVCLHFRFRSIIKILPEKTLRSCRKTVKSKVNPFQTTPSESQFSIKKHFHRNLKVPSRNSFVTTLNYLSCLQPASLSVAGIKLAMKEFSVQFETSEK